MLSWWRSRALCKFSVIRFLIFVTLGVAVAGLFAFLLVADLSERKPEEVWVALAGVLFFGISLGVILFATVELDSKASSRSSVQELKRAFSGYLNPDISSPAERARAKRAQQVALVPFLIIARSTIFLFGGDETNDSFEDIREIQRRQGPSWILAHIPATATNVFMTVNKKQRTRWFRYELPDEHVDPVPAFVMPVSLNEISGIGHTWPKRDLGWIEPPWSADVYLNRPEIIKAYSGNCLNELGRGFYVQLQRRRQVFAWCIAL